MSFLVSRFIFSRSSHPGVVDIRSPWTEAMADSPLALSSESSNSMARHRCGRGVRNPSFHCWILGLSLFHEIFSLPARWGLLDFMLVARLLLPSFFLPPPSSSFFLAGPHLPALDRSGPRRTSSASSWSQWASPDLHCQLSIAVGLAGPQPARVWALWASPNLHRRESERYGPRRTDGRPHRYAR